MRNCVLCGTERDDVSAVQVIPATWNGFNNFADVCAECQQTKRFKTYSKTKKAGEPASTGIAVATSTVSTPRATATKTSNRVTEVQIIHKRTGALLHTLESHTLAGASLSGVALSGADLQHAALRGTDLHRADLRMADLSGADLRGADLRGVNLRGADLRGADLRETKLYQADLSHAVYDGLTRWPADFDPRSSGARREVRAR